MRAVSVYAPLWNKHDSYGILARRLAEGIERCGLHVNRLGLDNEGGVLIPAPGGILLGYPTLYEKFGPLAQMGKRVAVTMFESTMLPEGWVEGLNACNAVVVPSRFLVEIFRAEGVTVPIHVVALGINEAYLNVERPARSDRPYTFLAIADRGLRKGWDLAWHAFRSAFHDDPNYKLILKCREGGVSNLVSADSNVEILRADYSDEEMAELYARCDCMVFPSRGEGFGLPPREFAATGGSVIATNWGGMADDIELWGYGIAYQMVSAWVGHEKFYGLGEWAEPDVKHLSHLMQVVRRDDLFWDNRRSLYLRAISHAYYDWNNFSDAVLKIYKEA
jgi:glycosyltransferase involved in cell wall biosynthesis